MPTKEELIAYVEKSPHPEVKIAACDIDGILRGKYIAKEKFLSSLEKGLGFCDVVFGWDSADVLYDNGTLTGWHTGYPDLLTKLDPNTFRKIPWEENRAFVLGDFYLKNGDPYPVCPRNLLKRVIEKYHKAGLEPFCSVEYEFFLFDETPQSLHEKGFQNLKPSSPGMFGYSILRSSARSEFISSLVRQMKEYDCPIEGIHTETGPGVMEAALLYTKALDAADRAVLFKTAVKELAYKDGKVATFMAKCNDQLPGCGGHTHISLWKNGANAFADERNKSGMSSLFENFLAGVLHGLHDFMAFYAPTINSYKRSVPGVWSPLNATWGLENRTAALRVILGQDPKSTRVEQRTPGADLNPYIAIAATLASGLYGIEKKMPLLPAVKGSAYNLSSKEYPLLPRSLAEATERLKRSEIAREMMGEEFVDHYVRTRDWEVREFNKAVTNWELKRYMEII